MSFALDTLTIAKRLQKAGASKQLAEEQAAIWAETLKEDIATKQNVSLVEVSVQGLRREMNAEIQNLRSEMREIEQRLTSKIVLAQLATVVAVVTILGFILGK